MISRSLAAGGLATVGLLAATSGAHAAFTIDGAVSLPRSVHNAFPDSNLTITNNVATTGDLIIDENTYGTPDLGAPFFANRSDAQLSSDGGATAHAILNQDNFSVSFDIKLDSVNPLNRKETGIVFSNTTTGDGQLIVVSDNGEIASFGGLVPFTCNLCGGLGDYGGAAYSLGDTVSVQAIYRHGVGSTATTDLVKPASIEFIINGISSGLRYVGNLENGFVDGTTINLYLQSQPVAANLATEDNTATYSNVAGGSLIEGDLNADGFVGIDDLNIILSTWNESQDPIAAVDPTFLSDLRADPSNDNFVGIDDLNLVLGNWNAGTPPAPSAVPEPATLTLLAMSGVAMLRRRRLN